MIKNPAPFYGNPGLIDGGYRRVLGDVRAPGMQILYFQRFSDRYRIDMDFQM